MASEQCERVAPLAALLVVSDDARECHLGHGEAAVADVCEGVVRREAVEVDVEEEVAASISPSPPPTRALYSIRSYAKVSLRAEHANLKGGSTVSRRAVRAACGYEGHEYSGIVFRF